MRKIIPEPYLALLNQRDFLILSLIIFLFQVANAFILLALIVTVFIQTGSNFGVSGVILSFATPGLLLMAFGGVAADLFDRRKLMFVACALLAVVVLMIMFTIDKVFASISFSFLYFAITSFFLPASSAATVQLVVKPRLLAANAVFILTLVGGQLFGFLLASLVHFFWGNLWMLVACELMLISVIWLVTLLPKLAPRVKKTTTITRALFQIWSAFLYIFSKKIVWFFFLTFALMQGLIAFGVTLGPGFFNDILGIAIDKSPLLALPPVIAGVILGVVFVQNSHIGEGSLVAAGLGAIGLAALVIGTIFKLGIVQARFMLIPTWVLLTFFGFGIIVVTIAARAALQRAVAHNFAGTVFGAMVVAAAFLAGLMSPLAAGLEVLVGYVNILIFGGMLFVMTSLALAQIGTRWKF